jgi:hypothetical protein
VCPGRFGQPENPARQQVAESRRVGREKQRDILNGKIKEMIALQKTSAGLKDFLIGS